MKQRKLKNWVKYLLIIFPVVVTISELFFIGINLNKISEGQKKNNEFIKDYLCTQNPFNWSCYDEQ